MWIGIPHFERRISTSSLIHLLDTILDLHIFSSIHLFIYSSIHLFVKIPFSIEPLGLYLCIEFHILVLHNFIIQGYPVPTTDEILKGVFAKMKGGLGLRWKIIAFDLYQSYFYLLRLWGKNCEKRLILKNVASIQIQKVAIYDSYLKIFNLISKNHTDIKTYSHRLFFIFSYYFKMYFEINPKSA